MSLNIDDITKKLRNFNLGDISFFNNQNTNILFIRVTYPLCKILNDSIVLDDVIEIKKVEKTADHIGNFLKKINCIPFMYLHIDENMKNKYFNVYDKIINHNDTVLNKLVDDNKNNLIIYTFGHCYRDTSEIKCDIGSNTFKIDDVINIITKIHAKYNKIYMLMFNCEGAYTLCKNLEIAMKKKNILNKTMILCSYKNIARISSYKDYCENIKKYFDNILDYKNFFHKYLKYKSKYHNLKTKKNK